MLSLPRKVSQIHFFIWLRLIRCWSLSAEQIIDGVKNTGVWGELPVYLFRGFVRRILTTAVDDVSGQRLVPRIPIDREELPLKRSLISQLLSQLKAQGKLKAIGALSGSEGCVNTIATLVGEIQRAAKSPHEVAEIIASRARDFPPPQNGKQTVHTQSEYDQEVSLIYSTYCALLDQFQLTEADADQRRALAVVNGELERTNIPPSMAGEGKTAGTRWVL